MSLDALYSKNREELQTLFRKCCGSVAWVNEMMKTKVDSENELYSVSQEIWEKLTEKDWLEAFSHHPKIGDLKSIREKFANTTKWAASEQSGVDGASEEVIQRLVIGNKEYEEKFGYIFIVFASGKSAKEMLNLLEERLPNDPAQEILIAAGEQLKITQFRLKKLLDEI